MAKEKIFGNETDSPPTIRKRYSRLNPKKTVTKVKFLKELRGLRGTVIARTFEVSYRKKRK